MANDEKTFAWHRPKDVATSIFLDFTGEVEEAVGVGNAALLEDVDTAMNSPHRMPSCLTAGAEEADALAAATGAPRESALACLAFLSEIEYRKAFGPALWERRSGPVPCQDALPPTAGQVRAGQFALHRLLGRIWNWSLIVVISGMFPFVILPLCGVAMFGRSAFYGHSALRWLALAVLGIWSAAFLSFFTAFFASRRLFGRRMRRRKAN